MNKSQSNKPSQLRLSATAVLLALSLASPVAMPAGLSDMLNEQFNTMSNITMPGVFETQRRGVLSGGSIATRSKIVNTQVVSMVSPGWKAGCGGIDLFAGSFSFINGDQFVQLLRSIASNAAGYAFQVALSTVCEQCMTWISSLQKSMQALNQFAGNSCQLAQGIVNQATDGMDFVDWKGRQGQSLTNMAKGFTTDFLSSWTQSGGESPEETRKNNDPTGYQEEVTGNIVWREIKTSNVSRWFTDSNGNTDNELLQQLMSLTGTVVVEDLKNDENGEKVNPTTPYDALIRLSDLALGNANATVYRCNNYDANGCLSPTSRQLEITGLKDRYREVLLSVVQKYATDPDGSTMEEQEKNVVTSLPASLGASLRNLAVQSEPAARDLVERSSAAIAVDQTYTAAVEMIQAVRVAISKAKSDKRDRVYAQLIKVENNLRADYAQLVQTYGSIRGALDYAHLVNRNVRKTEVWLSQQKKAQTTNG